MNKALPVTEQKSCSLSAAALSELANEELIQLLLNETHKNERMVQQLLQIGVRTQQDVSHEIKRNHQRLVGEVMEKDRLLAKQGQEI